MISLDDFEAQKIELDSLAAHLRPRVLEDLFIYAVFGEAGWPLPALAYAADDVSQSSGGNKDWETIGTIVIGKHASGNPRVIPMRPVWLGLFVDTALYGLLTFAFATVLVRLRRYRRSRVGRCLHCGYDLAGISPPCPECGQA